MHNPTTENALADIIAATNAPLNIIGGGTRDYGRPVIGETLSTANLTGIKLYDPGALTIVVAAGTPLGEVAAKLATENQRLAFEPMDHRAILGTKGTPTIGGAIAANISGPRRISVGAARDFLLGVRFVDGHGNIIKNGGRVMKNVTGYDLVKLLAGSHGTLGVLSEISLKTLPDVEAEATLTVQAKTAKQAVNIMSSALCSPFDVTGAGYDPAKETVYLRIEGFKESVSYRQDKLIHHINAGADIQNGKDSQEIWQNHRDLHALQSTTDDIWRISVKPSDAPDLINHLNPNAYQLDWGGGLIWAAADPGADIRPTIANFKGHATLIRAAIETRQNIASFHPQSAPIEAIANGLRQKFDPKGILNPRRTT